MKKKSLLLVLIFALLFGSVPIQVLAETATYTPLAVGECAYITYSNTTVNIAGNAASRAVVLRKQGSNQFMLWLVSTTKFKYAYSTSGCSTYYNSNTSALAGHTGYYSTSAFNSNFVSSNVAQVFIQSNEDVTDSNVAFKYTFGSGAVDPAEPVNWGQLRDVNYSTRIAGSGQASMANEDTITWDTIYDTFGNELTEDCTVEIRAVKGSWTASLKEDLLSFVGDTFSLSQLVAPTLATVPASQGSFSIEWDEVCNALDISTYLAILAYQDTNNVYQKEGWIYEVRLKNSEDQYVGTWQRVYTATSASAQGSESLVINSDMNINVNQALQEIAILNDQETVNININNTNYFVENPTNGTEPDGGTNLWDLLKALLSGIFQLLEKLGDIAVAIVQAVGDLLSGLLDLIRQLVTPPDSIDSTVTNNFNYEINNYLETDQPQLFAIQNSISDTAAELKSLANGQAGSCVISWNDVTINLSAFNAGNVKLLDQGSIDFGQIFNDMLVAAGLDYSTYSFFVSGIIYIFLIVFIDHKIVGFLRKS